MDFWSNLNHEIQCDSVLELACGTGRLGAIFLRDGSDYTGIDNNPSFVKSAKKKLNSYGARVSIKKFDMRSFNLDKKYDLILIGFNSFLHLLTDKDATDCLNCVKNHMHKNSRFVIDIYVPNPLFLYRPEEVRFPVLEYTNSKTNNRVYVQESNIYDSKSEIKAIEAGHYGIPLVCTDVGCYDEVIKDGETGYLIPKDNDRNKWKSTLVKLIKDKKRIKRMGQNLKEIVDEHYDINKIVGGRLELYNQLLEVKAKALEMYKKNEDKQGLRPTPPHPHSDDLILS